MTQRCMYDYSLKTDNEMKTWGGWVCWQNVEMGFIFSYYAMTRLLVLLQWMWLWKGGVVCKEKQEMSCPQTGSFGKRLPEEHLPGSFLVSLKPFPFSPKWRHQRNSWDHDLRNELRKSDVELEGWGIEVVTEAVSIDSKIVQGERVPKKKLKGSG